MRRRKKKHLYKIACYLGKERVGQSKYTNNLKLAIREALFQPNNIVCVVFKLVYGKYKRIARYKGGKRIKLKKKSAKRSMFFKKGRKRKKRSDAGKRRVTKKMVSAWFESGRVANGGRVSFHFGSSGYKKRMRKGFEGISLKSKLKKRS